MPPRFWILVVVLVVLMLYPLLYMPLYMFSAWLKGGLGRYNIPVVVQFVNRPPMFVYLCVCSHVRKCSFCALVSVFKPYESPTLRVRIWLPPRSFVYLCVRSHKNCVIRVLYQIVSHNIHVRHDCGNSQLNVDGIRNLLLRRMCYF